jgi:dienelactone hydrolase
MAKFLPAFERCEDRTLMTLVFVLNGNSFNSANPNDLTANAAAILHKAGNRVIQLSNAQINSAAAFKSLTAAVTRMAHGQTVGLAGFSAGGALALHIAASPGLNVSSVLDYYGVPDVGAYLERHAADHFYRPISGLAPFRPSLVALLSGPLPPGPHVVAAFGEFDPHVQADTSSADLLHDDPNADIYTYAGAHGVPITASRPALDDFLAHLAA